MTESETGPFRIYCTAFTVNPPTPRVTGRICVSLRDYHFPDHDWNDCPLVILAWWLRAFTASRAGPEDIEFPFMDGPFLWRLSRQTAGPFILRCVKRGQKREYILHELLIDAQSVANELIRAARAALFWCAQQKLENADTKELSAALRTLD